jgi:hypothetical protein
MTELAKDVTAIDVTDLLTRYSFDLGGYTVEQLVDAWLHHYPIKWVRLAVIEALYQGRYKAFSVEQILNLWKRRGKSLYRFNHEFERIICGRFPGHATALPRFYHSPVRSPSRSVNQASHHATTASVVPPMNSIETQPSLPSLTPEPKEHKSESEAEAGSDTVLPEPIDTENSPSPPSRGVPVSPFKPDARLELEPLAALSTARSPVHREPIHQFVPASEFSDFYAKLRLVAQEAATDGDEFPLN